MSARLRGVRGAAVGVCFALALAGCAPQASGGAQDAGAIPEFTGPYAEEFAQLHERTNDPFVREVIADSEISDQEIVETRNRYSSCMSEQGLFDIEFEEGETGVSYGFPPSMGSQCAVQLSEECETSTGYAELSVLYASMRSNPQNEDMAELIAECLVRHGAVPEGYTAEDYRRDFMQGSYPFTDPTRGQAVLEQCEVTPLE